MKDEKEKCRPITMADGCAFNSTNVCKCIKC